MLGELFLLENSKGYMEYLVYFPEKRLTIIPTTQKVLPGYLDADWIQRDFNTHSTRYFALHDQDKPHSDWYTQFLGAANIEEILVATSLMLHERYLQSRKLSDARLNRKSIQIASNSFVDAFKHIGFFKDAQQFYDSTNLGRVYNQLLGDKDRGYDDSFEDYLSNLLEGNR